MPPKQESRINPLVHAEAIEWLIRFSEDEVDQSGREEFSAWLKRSPDHINAYLHLTAFWQEAGRPPAGEDRIDVDRLVALAQRESNVFPLGLGGREAASPADPSAAISPARPRKVHRWALAASLVVLSGAAALFYYSTQLANVYTTAIGEQRIVNLPDGSSVKINARSRIKVRYDEHERRIDLQEGQVLFKVAANATRPFIVHAGQSTIRALGTEFDVYRKASGTVVTVVEGRVAVSPQTVVRAMPVKAEELAAGEQAVVTPTTTRKERPKHIETVTAWTQGLLVFESTPLRDVVAEYNRQNARPLVIEDPELAELTITATFPASGSERIVKFLQDRFAVSVADDSSEIRISRSP